VSNHTCLGVVYYPDGDVGVVCRSLKKLAFYVPPMFGSWEIDYDVRPTIGTAQ
jgi:hypothetical protein